MTQTENVSSLYIIVPAHPGCAKETHSSSVRWGKVPDIFRCSICSLTRAMPWSCTHPQYYPTTQSPPSADETQIAQLWLTGGQQR
eukprot:2622776-Amphidinium_carterae.1